MFTRTTCRLSVGIALLLSAGNLSAQSIQNAGSAGAQFLKIGVGARAMGMGGAYASMSNDPAALAWNPAGIGTMSSLQISAEHTSWVSEIDHSFVGLVVPVTDQLNLGFHTIFLSSGDIEITTIDNPEGTGQFYDASDVAVGLTSAIRLTHQLTFATTIKYIEERLYDVSSSGVAIDAGAWYSTEFHGLNLGFVVSNLGFDQEFSGRSLEVQYDPPEPGEPLADSELQTLPFNLPLTFRASGSIDLFHMSDQSSEDHSLITALDFIQHTDTQERLAVGMEYTWRGLLSLRSGYLFNADELSWSAGGGVRVDVSDFRIGFDYAASSLGRFGIGHRVGLVIGY